MSVRRLSIVFFALSTLVFFIHFISGGSKGPNDNTLIYQNGDHSSSFEGLGRKPQAVESERSVGVERGQRTDVSKKSFTPRENQNNEVDLEHSSRGVGIANEKESALLLLDPSEWCLAAKEGYEALVERIGRLDQLLSAPATGLTSPTSFLVQQLNADLFNVSDLKGSLSQIMRNFLEIPLHPDGSSSSSSNKEISSRNCYAKAREVIKRRHLGRQAGYYGSKYTDDSNTIRKKRRLFIDMGSRSGDQTTMFLRKFPEASSYEIHCFEANPAFNQWYVANSRPNLFYHNEAVGVVNTSMWLSDRDVGSSIVDGKSTNGSGIEVKVIDFSHFLIQSALFPHHQRSESESSFLRSGHPTKIIIKMDIEKMEYSVLLKMFTTGAFLLVDDLLLECHYTTNKWRGAVDRPDGAIGKEDCKDFVHALNVGMNAWQQNSRNHVASSSSMSTEANDDMLFEAVLWNSVKTARSSGYIARHGGFLPT